jgi:hypothetical protein
MYQDRIQLPQFLVASFQRALDKGFSARESAQSGLASLQSIAHRHPWRKKK